MEQDASETLTSGDVSVTKAKTSMKSKKGKRKRRDKKSVTSEMAQPLLVPMVETADMMTQTDSDFVEFLQMSEEEYQEYQMYKEKQLRQQYLVETVQEIDFQVYDAE